MEIWTLCRTWYKLMTFKSRNESRNSLTPARRGFAVRADFWRLWWLRATMSQRQQRATDTVTFAPRWKHLWRQHGITGGTLAGILTCGFARGRRTLFANVRSSLLGKNQRGETPLLLAIRWNRFVVAREILKHSAMKQESLPNLYHIIRDHLEVLWAAERGRDFLSKDLLPRYLLNSEVSVNKYKGLSPPPVSCHQSLW